MSAYSPSFIARKPAEELVLGSGLINSSGILNVSFLYKAYVAGEIIQGHRVVAVLDNELFKASNILYTDKVMGISLSAVGLGDLLKVQGEGVLVEPSWTWNINIPIYLGSDGLLTQTVPILGTLLQVAIPVSSTSILIDIGIPIIL